MTNNEVTVKFAVQIKYSMEEGAVFCEASARENLQSAIENERQNGVLTPYDISADWVATKVVANTAATNIIPIPLSNFPLSEISSRPSGACQRLDNCTKFL